MQKTTTLLILVDGLRHDYINHDDAPFLARLSELNITANLRETFAFELRPAFFAGLQPNECDVANMYYYDPEDSPFRHIDTSHGDRDRIRNDLRAYASQKGYSLIKHVGGPAEIPLPYLKYFNFSEKINTPDPGSLGDRETLFDRLRVAGKTWLWIGYPDGPAYTKDIFSLFHERFSGEDLVYLHFSELDWAGHEHGPHSSGQKQTLREIDEAIRQVYVHLNRNDTCLKSVIFGDHGMVAVRQWIDIEAALRRTELEPVRDYLYFLDSTQARFWFFTDLARDVIFQLLVSIPDGRVLEEEVLAQLHFNFPHNKFGDLVYVVNDGVGIFPNFFQHENPCKGLHGYLPDVVDNWAKLIITGCCERKEMPNPIDLVDLYSILLEMLEINTEQNVSKLTVLGIPYNTNNYEISLVMPTFNRCQTLKKTIAALEQQTCSNDKFELIVVNDGSSDNTEAFLDEIKSETTLNIRCLHQLNSGPASARNAGIRIAEGKIVLLVGDDMIPPPTFISQHLKFHEEWPGAAHACLGRIEWSDTLEVSEFMRHVTSDKGGQQFCYSHLQTMNCDSIPWEYFWSSNISVKRHMFNTYGMFNDSIFKHAMWEDVELGYRLAQCGLTIHYRNEIVTYHEHSISIESFTERQRMVGWYYADMEALGVPVSFRPVINDNKIYSRRILNELLIGVSSLHEETVACSNMTMSDIYNYLLDYAFSVGYAERQGRVNENIGAALGTLLNIGRPIQVPEDNSKLQQETVLPNNTIISSVFKRIFKQ